MRTPRTKLSSFMMEVGTLATAAFGFWRFFAPVPAQPESSASESESGPPAEPGPLDGLCAAVPEGSRIPLDVVHLQALKAVATVWAAWNLSDAVAWARLLMADADSSGGMIALAYDVVQRQPKDVLRRVLNIDDASIRVSALEVVGQAWTACVPFSENAEDRLLLRPDICSDGSPV